VKTGRIWDLPRHPDTIPQFFQAIRSGGEVNLPINRGADIHKSLYENIALYFMFFGNSGKRPRFVAAVVENWGVRILRGDFDAIVEYPRLILRRIRPKCVPFDVIAFADVEPDQIIDTFGRKSFDIKE